MPWYAAIVRSSVNEIDRRSDTSSGCTRNCSNASPEKIAIGAATLNTKKVGRLRTVIAAGLDACLRILRDDFDRHLTFVAARKDEGDVECLLVARKVYNLQGLDELTLEALLKHKVIAISVCFALEHVDGAALLRISY